MQSGETSRYLFTNPSGHLIHPHKSLQPNRFGARHQQRGSYKKYNHLHSRLITEDQNKSLNRLITMEEVEEAVRDMPNGKAPGPDGFTINFYKSCWEIVSVEVWEVVEDS